jgi:hypothetical protein
MIEFVYSFSAAKIRTGTIRDNPKKGDKNLMNNEQRIMNN